MEIDTDFEARLEKHFQERFSYCQRDLRGTEVEIMAYKTSAHGWFMSGAEEMRVVFMRMVREQATKWANELDPARIR